MKVEIKLFFLGFLKQNPAEPEVADCKDVVARAHRTILSRCCSVVCLIVAHGVEMWVAESSHVKYSM